MPARQEGGGDFRRHLARCLRAPVGREGRRAAYRLQHCLHPGTGYCLASETQRGRNARFEEIHKITMCHIMCCTMPRGTNCAVIRVLWAFEIGIYVLQLTELYYKLFRNRLILVTQCALIFAFICKSRHFD
jgi:hypothetical protein